MRAYVLLAGAAMSLMGITLTAVADDPAAAPAKQNSPQPEKKEAAADAAPNTSQPGSDKKADAKSNGDKDVRKSDKNETKEGPKEGSAQKPGEASRPELPSNVPAKYAAEEKAIREVHAALIKAYSTDDAKGVVEKFTSDAEYINAQGSIFQGRKEIEESLAESMTEHPGCKLESEIDAIRFVGPNLALVDATVTVNHAEDEQEITTICHSAVVYLKTGNKWEIASVRDEHTPSMSTAEEELAQLDFLKGDWVDEHQNSRLAFSCRPDENGKFLLRDFTLKLSGHAVLKGTQRIGWDPVGGHLRTWIFDSEGGFAEGIWQRTEDGWLMTTEGVTASGEIAIGTSIYKIIDDHTITWQAVDHEVNGERMEDSPVFTLTHQAPKPSDGDEPPAVSKKE